MIGANPFDWYGGAFLALYAFLLVGAILCSLLIAAWLRPEGQPGAVGDDDELALLAGGRNRLGEAVLARLLARRAITIGHEGVYTHVSPTGASSAERDLLSLPSPFRWKAASEMIAGAATQLEQRLIDRGLLMELEEQRRLRAYAVLPLVLLTGFGLIKVMVGLSRERPVGYLLAFLAVTVIVAIILIVSIDRRTRYGIHLVSETRQRSERLGRAPTEAEAGTAVALFGTAVLVGSPMAELHGIRRQSDGSTSRGSDSSGGGCGGGGGGGSSGCGGGGCGGCGG